MKFSWIKVVTSHGRGGNSSYKVMSHHVRSICTCLCAQKRIQTAAYAHLLHFILHILYRKCFDFMYSQSKKKCHGSVWEGRAILHYVKTHTMQGTLLSGHSSTADTHDQTDYSKSPDCLPKAFNQGWIHKWSGGLSVVTLEYCLCHSPVMQKRCGCDAGWSLILSQVPSLRAYVEGISLAPWRWSEKK